MHEGTTLPTNRAADPRHHTQYASFSFVEPGAVDVEVHQNISPDGTNLTINVQALTNETRMAMDHWFKAVETDAVLNANVEQNLPRLARQQQKQSFVRTPTPTGTPISTHIHITTSST
jgi:hypothetical protein